MTLTANRPTTRPHTGDLSPDLPSDLAPDLSVNLSGDFSPSPAFRTDRYELTMIDAARAAGVADRPSVFEVFTRSLPSKRRFGVFAGLGRLLPLIEEFRFSDAQLAYLETHNVVSADTLAWLADFRFSGDIRAYREGELFFPNSPVLTVKATFAEAVLLETLILSVLNHDSAIASAAARMVAAAGGRRLIEMGSRRTHDAAAVATARAAYLAGFDATSNLEAGLVFNIPTVGTSAHAFTLLHDSEAEAFSAQVASQGVGTTLLVDTYDIDEGVRTAVKVAGPQLGAVRIDSGDLYETSHRVRALLDSLGAHRTKIVVTSDLDEYTISRLAAAPIDSFGVGTRLATGSGVPTVGFVYKLVAREDASGDMVPVEKRSENKVSVGGEKWAYRLVDDFGAHTEHVAVGSPCRPATGRLLNPVVVADGVVVAAPDLAADREFSLAARAELADGLDRTLTVGPPAVRTEHTNGEVCAHRVDHLPRNPVFAGSAGGAYEERSL